MVTPRSFRPKAAGWVPRTQRVNLKKSAKEGFGGRMLDSGGRMLGFGDRILGFGGRMMCFGDRILGFGGRGTRIFATTPRPMTSLSARFRENKVPSTHPHLNPRPSTPNPKP